jgi:hypothetical protein
LRTAPPTSPQYVGIELYGRSCPSIKPAQKDLHSKQ